MLRFPVKVNSITNLTDARYCAGMGVEMIGFSISDGHGRFISPEKTNGITGWLSGVKVVAESYSNEQWNVLQEKASSISAEILEIGAAELNNAELSGLPLIVRLSIGEWESVKDKISQEAVLHLLLEDTDFEATEKIREICNSRATFLNFDKLDLDSIQNLLSKVVPYGITIEGGNELSPGMSDFDQLAEVLEYLEA